MEALEVASLARDMAKATNPARLVDMLLRTVVGSHGLRCGLCYWRDAAGDQLLPLACTQTEPARLPAIPLSELENPLVYSLVEGKPCHIGQIGALVGVGESFEFLREHLPGRDALSILPLWDRKRQAIGSLVLAGAAPALQAVQGDALWQALMDLHEQLLARLRERLGTADTMDHERALSRHQEAERGRARAVRLLAAEFVGTGASARRLREEMLRLADSSLAVLVTGETGSGKDHAAWLIHQASSRDGKFVPVNCAAIPKDLIEAELFGSVRGAFTGATQARSGLVAEADGGTLFLDEIGDMPVALQGTLLRLLNEKKFRPVGANREQASDFRLICATHQPLLQLIRDGRFREDLYFRIRQQTLHLPPLRERREDIAALATHVLLQHNRGRQSHITGIEPRAMALLQTHSLPGNVRELRSLVLAAAERTPQGKAIGADTIRDLQATLDAPEPAGAVDPVLRSLWLTTDLPSAVADFERLLVSERLRQADGSRRRAAQSLGIPKRTLARKCQFWNLDREDSTA
ncbi:sigma 54-interacting transcriptional regulator [Cupriavidus sp. 30B13]|uniref:sigma 54-interacting transcriptional regulator n=1 Tax=Cupriavidus sp. 30B13 TaxID=3384241 RepID=UPI003B90187F